MQKDGSIYIGFLKNKQKTGTGRVKFNDYSIFEGEFENDSINGYGELFGPKGELIYHGYWKNNKYHGKGIKKNYQKNSISEIKLSIDSSLK